MRSLGRALLGGGVPGLRCCFVPGRKGGKEFVRIVRIKDAGCRSLSLKGVFRICKLFLHLWTKRGRTSAEPLFPEWEPF